MGQEIDGLRVVGSPLDHHISNARVEIEVEYSRESTGDDES
jgi:hypothetical protein